MTLNIVDPPAANETAKEFKTCCADFYADDIVRKILGESFHPGGTDLTRSLLDTISLTSDQHLLDVAAGQGTSSLFAVETTGCRVTALDLSAENLDRAGAEAERRGIRDRLVLKQSDAERLPFDDNTFDAILCECAFCVFTDKATAASEMFRVLKPGGNLALSDMTITGKEAPDDLRSLLSRVACIADAVSAEKLVKYFSDAKFESLFIKDASFALQDMVKQISGRLLAVELASKIGKLNLGGVNLLDGKQMVAAATDAIQNEAIGYVTMFGKKDI